MMSGMLLIDREPDVKKIWTSRIPRFVFAILFRLLFFSMVVLAGIFAQYFMYGIPINFRAFDHFENMDNTFLYCIIGLYIIYPFIHDFCKSRERELYFIMLSVCFTSLIPMLENISKISSVIIHVNDSMNMYFPIGYSMFFVMGHYLYKYFFPRIEGHSCRLTIIMIISIAFNCIARYSGWPVMATKVSYGSISEFLMCSSVFCFFGTVVSKWDIHNIALVSTINKVGKAGMSVFILHWAVVSLIRTAGIMPSAGHFLVGIPLWTTIVYVICYYLGKVWMRIPFLNKIIC